MTRILLIAPVGTTMHLPAEVSSARRAVSSEVDVEVHHLPALPQTIYVPPVEQFVPELVKAAVSAEEDGFDGIGISCCSDPGLEQVRNAVSIPVSAPFEAARALLPQFAPLSVFYIDVPPGPGESVLKGTDWVPEIISRYKADDLVTVPEPIRISRPAVGSPGQGHDPATIGAALIEAQREGLQAHGPAAAKRAEEAGARTIFLACTYWTGLAETLRGETDLFVLDPIEVLARHVEILARTAKP